MDLREKADQLPAQPGVYLFQDAGSAILYVGKARSLRGRVKSYFLESRWQDAKTGSLVREIADLEYIVVDNEREALALENNLIKRHKPKFNVLLRDDKTYPYIRYTAFEKYPRIYVTRRLAQRWLALLRSVLPCQPRLPARASDSQTFSGALLHRRFNSPPSSPLPAVLHSSLPRPLCRSCVATSATQKRRATSGYSLEGRRSDLSRSLEPAHGDGSE